MLQTTLAEYLKRKYGKRLKKICIDGGFGCPNRDGTAGHGGCIYCGERGAGEHIADGCGFAPGSSESIRAQVDKEIKKASPEDEFIAYFQNFTNTYADIDTLRMRYDSALISDRIKILAIGTRPDCITERIAELIAEYGRHREVWVELGLQSASDETARLINRGYKTEVYRGACEILRAHGIKFITHMIIGLPGENDADIDRTVDEINLSGSFGVKLHSIYVMEGTALANMYKRGEYTPPEMEDYIRLARRALSRLSTEITVHRLTGDCPRGLLVAPDWNTRKNEIIEKIRKA